MGRYAESEPPGTRTSSLDGAEPYIEVAIQECPMRFGLSPLSQTGQRPKNGLEQDVESDGDDSVETTTACAPHRLPHHQSSVCFEATDKLEQQLSYAVSPRSEGSERTRTPESKRHRLASPFGVNSTSSSWRSTGYSQLGDFPNEKDPARRRRLRPAQSAPMLPVNGSPFQQNLGSTSSSWRTSGNTMRTSQSSWHTWRSRREAPVYCGSIWRPLGGTWRDRSFGTEGPPRNDVDDGSSFVNGCVPQWGHGGAKRRTTQLEHEFTWMYYHMKRHVSHPLRREVGETLPNERVPAPMRLSKKAAFNFWEHLRPPFRVVHIERVDEADEKHRDGDLFRVTYVCGIDYSSERAYGITSENSTFDNLCNGTATVRIPDGFPHQSLVFLSWGKPCLGSPPAQKVVAQTDVWPPTAGALSPPAGHRLGTADSQRILDVSPTQKMLMGPSASLPQLVANEVRLGNVTERTATGSAMASSPLGPSRRRSHRIYTAAAGFIRYSG